MLAATAVLLASCGSVGVLPQDAAQSEDSSLAYTISDSKVTYTPEDGVIQPQGAASYTWITFSKTEEIQSTNTRILGRLDNSASGVKGTLSTAVQSGWTATAGASNTVSVAGITASLGITYSMQRTDTVSAEVPAYKTATIYGYPIGYRYKGRVRECVQNMGLFSCVERYADFFSPRTTGYKITN